MIDFNNALKKHTIIITRILILIIFISIFSNATMDQRVKIYSIGKESMRNYNIDISRSFISMIFTFIHIDILKQEEHDAITDPYSMDKISIKKQIEDFISKHPNINSNEILYILFYGEIDPENQSIYNFKFFYFVVDNSNSEAFDKDSQYELWGNPSYFKQKIQKLAINPVISISSSEYERLKKEGTFTETLIEDYAFNKESHNAHSESYEIAERGYFQTFIDNICLTFGRIINILQEK